MLHPPLCPKWPNSIDVLATQTVMARACDESNDNNGDATTRTQLQRATPGAAQPTHLET